MSWTPTDEQVEKAARALAEEFGWRDFGTLDPQALDTAKAGVRAVLVAVGPMIAATELRSEADRIDAGAPNQTAWTVRNRLRQRADQIEKEAGR